MLSRKRAADWRVPVFLHIFHIRNVENVESSFCGYFCVWANVFHRFSEKSGKYPRIRRKREAHLNDIAFFLAAPPRASPDMAAPLERIGEIRCGKTCFARHAFSTPYGINRGKRKCRRAPHSPFAHSAGLAVIHVKLL